MWNAKPRYFLSLTAKDYQIKITLVENFHFLNTGNGWGIFGVTLAFLIQDLNVYPC